MFCNQCGAKLPDGVKFCTECGAPIANTAAPSAPVKEDNEVNYRPVAPQPTPAQPSAPQQPVKAAQPQPQAQPAAPVYGAAQSQTQPQARPVAPQPTAAPVYGAAQPQPQARQGAYTPPQGQSRTVPPQGQPNGYAQPGYPQPQPGYAQPQQGAYGYGNQAPYAAPPKKKNNAVLIIVLAIVAVVVVLAVALVLFLKLRYEEPPLPPLTEPTTVVTETETATETAGTTEASAETTKPAAQTTESATETTKASATAGLDTPLTDAEIQAVLEKTVGYWNTEDQRRFIGITRMDGGIYYFTYAYWYSEVDLVGYLRKPVTGNPNGIVSIHLYYEGYESAETGYSMPSVDTDVLFDLSKASEGVIQCNISGAWEEFRFGGDTMDAAMPPYESLFDVQQ